VGVEVGRVELDLVFSVDVRSQNGSGNRGLDRRLDIYDSVDDALAAIK
jgi:hypothetical protein